MYILCHCVSLFRRKKAAQRLLFTQNIVINEENESGKENVQLSESIVQTTVSSAIDIPRGLVIPSCNLKIHDLVGQGDGRQGGLANVHPLLGS